MTLSFPPPAQAFWIWTPQKGKFENPAKVSKETAAEQLVWAKKFLDSEEYDKAIKEFQKIHKHFPRSREAAEAAYYTALCQERKERYYEAFLSYQDLLVDHPQTERVHEVVEHQYRIANLFFKDEKLRVAGVPIPVLPTAARDKALEIYEKITENVPFGPHAAPAHYRMGVIYFEDEKFVHSILSHEALIRDFPNHELVPSAEFYTVQSTFALAERSDFDSDLVGAALEKLEEFSRNYPGSEHEDVIQERVTLLTEKRAEEHYQVAAFYEKQNYFSSAQVYYKDVISQFPQTRWAGLARERLTRLGEESEEVNP